MGPQMQIYLEFLFLFVKYHNILRSTKYFALQNHIYYASFKVKILQIIPWKWMFLGKSSTLYILIFFTFCLLYTICKQ